MTSEIGVEHVVEQQLVFRCSCGAAIEMTRKKETCADCGKTIEVVRCVATPKGKKYTLKVRQRRKGWNTEPHMRPSGVVPAAVHPPQRPFEATDNHKRSGNTDSTQPGGYPEAPNYDKGFKWLGSLMLLLGALLLVPLTIGPERLAIAMSRKPSDCDWLSQPLGDKHCHYEGSAVHDDHPGGDHISVKWQRVNDY